MQKEHIVETLREKGCRITKQRLMLIDIILEEECQSCKEIYYKAVKADAKNRNGNGLPDGKYLRGDRSHYQKQHVSDCLCKGM